MVKLDNSTNKINDNMSTNINLDSSNIKMECSICLNEIHEFNKVECSVCKSGIYHRECLGFWFYKKELKNLRRSIVNREKIKHVCTICKTTWEKKETKHILKPYIKAHFFLNNRKNLNIKVTDIYYKRLEYFNKYPINLTKKKSCYSFFSCFGTSRRTIRISPLY
tara:strand:- start:25 stop:519 length:495 start_codon:yes stop_codon:yes gene_type:complete